MKTIRVLLQIYKICISSFKNMLIIYHNFLLQHNTWLPEQIFIDALEIPHVWKKPRVYRINLKTCWIKNFLTNGKICIWNEGYYRHISVLPKSLWCLSILLLNIYSIIIGLGITLYNICCRIIKYFHTTTTEETCK